MTAPDEPATAAETDHGAVAAQPAGVRPGGAEPAGVQPAEAEIEESAAGPRSGLRNPQAAVRGLGAGTLVLEAIVLLLAIQPIRIMGGHLSGPGIGAVLGLAVLAILVAGMMKRRWAWHAGTAVQVLLLASGLFHWSLAVLGLIFGGAWAYASYVRKSILG